MTAPVYVLIAEDDPQIQKVLERIVLKMRLSPLLASSLPKARELAERFPVRLIILDRKLEDGKDSIVLCRELKKDSRTRLIPVIVLTGLEDFEEKIRSYQAGADLFLNKPPNPDELKSYIRAFLTRTPYRDEVGDKISFGRVTLDLSERSVSVGSRKYDELPAKQFDFLYLLASAQGKPQTREALVSKLWNNEVRDKEVDVLVSRLRDNLGEDSAIVEPVRGLGYRIAA